ncbi:hypothetical protein LCGC14_1260470 [marine sediment metagenome]|uniref:Uncharacterized protein n=1 Tax=marine sediment metagenome TaxID=412755 RepID=A0A0F9NHL8_9ZZZZ
MKVKCIYNSGKLLPQDLLNKQTTFKQPIKAEFRQPILEDKKKKEGG